MSKATYPLKLPLSVKKAAQRLAKEPGTEEVARRYACFAFLRGFSSSNASVLIGRQQHAIHRFLPP